MQTYMLDDACRQLAVRMIALKLARLTNGDPAHKDSWVDIAGYAMLVVRDMEEREMIGREKEGPQ